MSITPFRVPVVSKLKRDTIKALLSKNLRIDGMRDLVTPRNVNVEIGLIERAEGSALVKLGRTQVLAGVKLDIGTPYRDTPDQGVLTVHAEFVPLASPIFEPGPPDENAVELARVIDRSLREVGAIDLKSLVINEGERVWIVWVDLYIIDHDGNLFDASMLATMAALLNTKIPAYEELESGDVVIDRGLKGRKLPLRHKVVTVTLANIDGFIVVDPDYEEEIIADSGLVIAFDEEYRIVGMQKLGEGGWTSEQLIKAVDLAKPAAEVYFNALNEALAGGVSEEKREEESNGEED